MRYRNIPVSESTWERLKDYKMAGVTFDEVVSELMKSVPLDAVAERAVKEHHERARTFEGRPWRSVVRRP